MRAHWGTLLAGYFGKRESLRGTIVVMDVRHPLTEHDQDMLKLAMSRNLPVHILLTKADKLGRGAAGNALQGSAANCQRTASSLCSCSPRTPGTACRRRAARWKSCSMADA